MYASIGDRKQGRKQMRIGRPDVQKAAANLRKQMAIAPSTANRQRSKATLQAIAMGIAAV